MKQKKETKSAEKFKAVKEAVEVKAASKAVKAPKAVKETVSEAVDAKLEVVEDNAAEGKKMMLACMKGAAAGEALTTDSIANFKYLIPKKFHTSATGLTMDEGTEPTRAEIGQAISGLNRFYEGVDRVKGSLIWNIGDLCNIAEHAGIDDAVEQAADRTGKAKHTIQQAVHLAKFFPKERRRVELEATHHMEVYSYSKKKDEDGKRYLTDAKLFHFLDKAVKGEKIVDVVSATGEEIVHWKPVPCSTLRKWLQEACGIKPKEKPEKEEGEPEEKGGRGYLYIDSEFAVFGNPELSEIAVDSGEFLIIDLNTGRIIGPGGQEGADVLPLPDKYLAHEAPADEEKDSDLPD